MKLRDMFPFMNYAPILFVSAKTNQRMNKILDTVESSCKLNILRAYKYICN